jgi:hypothetical protein
MKPRPTVGRIVLFHDVGGIDRPSIVLRVGQVTRGCDLGVFGELGYGLVKDVPEGKTVGQWSWPVRE